MLRASLVVALLSIGSASALEQSVTHVAQSHDPANCYCRAQGRMFEEGQMVCLQTPIGNRMAACDMALNVMSWVITEEHCPVS